MTPFYFGESKSPLFGLYMPAKGRASRGAVVLCYPLGAEYMRSHRAFRQLSNLLARAGFDVLRFDYSSTGDSAGSSEHASFGAWLHDLDAAVEEMKEMTQQDSVALVGLRLGAAAAALGSLGRADVSRLVLWDPIVRGSDYVAVLRAAAVSPSGNGSSDGPIGVSGFPLTDGMLEELGKIDLLAAAARLPRTDLVVSEEDDHYRDLFAALNRTRSDAGLTLRPSPNNWMEGDAFGSALIPSAIIEGIVQQLSRE